MVYCGTSPRYALYLHILTSAEIIYSSVLILMLLLIYFSLQEKIERTVQRCKIIIHKQISHIHNRLKKYIFSNQNCVAFKSCMEGGNS